MIPTPENYRPEDALEHVQDSKGTDRLESFTVKKLRVGDYDDEGNIVSSSNIFADRVRRLSCVNSFGEIVYIIYSICHVLLPHYVIRCSL
jgi:hypothetical protein